jgi:hypothetical protein
MTQTETDSSPRRRRFAAVVILVALAALLGALALHFTAVSASRYAQGPGDLAARATAARRAAAMEPWNSELVRQATVLRQWERGQQLLDAGNYPGAVDVLQEAYSEDVGNAELLALFKKAQDAQALATNRKAHLQHGHEGPGGTLLPEDIER